MICKVVVFQPSRGEMRDLLQARLLADVGKIDDVQALGWSFYQIEFETPAMAARVLQLSPLITSSWPCIFSALADMVLTR